MNSFKITNHEIEFVFENCEAILIDESAIKQLRFITKSERFIYDAHNHDMMKSVEVEKFYIVLDITDKKNFHHPYSTMLTWGGTDSIITDGQKCIDRLTKCDDITHLYINGVCYHLPWDYSRYNNTYQNNTETTNTNGEHMLTITIKPTEDTTKVYNINNT